MQQIERLDRESCYRAVKSRDRRFDGIFYTAVKTTGIYCRPSCPARTPGLQNVSFFPTAAAAQAAGFRACKRCLPDATPGSPDWDVAADAAGRAMRLIADGVIDRDGVEGLAHRVGYTSRHLTRLLTAELGAGPLALARARRAQTARVLIETTEMSFADVAFASGFASIRQFNETIREVYAASPTDLRGRRKRPAETSGQVTMRLAVRTPYAGRALLGFLALRAVPGVEEAGPGFYARTLALPHGAGTVRVELDDVRDAGSTAFVTGALHADGSAGHGRCGGAHPPAARRRLRPRGGVRPVRRRPCPRSARATYARAPGPRSRRRQRGRDPGGARPAGHGGCRSHGREPADQAVRDATRGTGGLADATVPRRIGAGRDRPDRAADAEVPRQRPDHAVPSPGRRRHRARPRARPGRRPTSAGRPARDRTVDRRLHRAACARPPRRVPADRCRHPPRDDPTGSRPAAAGEASERWRPWRSYAQMHLWQTITSVVEPVETKEN